MEKVNIFEKFSLIKNVYEPKIVGELNGQFVKLVKFLGEFPWHKHENEDEMFYVVKGCMRMDYRDKSFDVLENEFVIAPRGIEHRPVAESEALVMLFEPVSTLNTGDIVNEMTKFELEKI